MTQQAAQIQTDELRLTPKGRAQMLLMDSGVNAETALQLTNPYKDKISRVAAHKLRAKYRKYSLTRPATVKLAERAVLDVLQDKPITVPAQKVLKDGQVIKYTDTIVPNHTNKLAAAAMVYDRYEPIKSNSADIGDGNTFIDLTIYSVSQTPQVEGSSSLPVQEAEVIEDKPDI